MKVTVTRELLRQVLDAAFSPYCTQDLGKLVPEIKRCLALQSVELEPVAWMMSGVDKETRLTFNRPSAEHRRLFTCIDPLYTAQPRKADGCNWPTCQTEQYQQDLTDQIAKELIGEQPRKAVKLTAYTDGSDDEAMERINAALADTE